MIRVLLLVLALSACNAEALQEPSARHELAPVQHHEIPPVVQEAPKIPPPTAHSPVGDKLEWAHEILKGARDLK
jgi:hypothetical protein